MAGAQAEKQGREAGRHRTNIAGSFLVHEMRTGILVACLKEPRRKVPECRPVPKP